MHTYNNERKRYENMTETEQLADTLEHGRARKLARDALDKRMAPWATSALIITAAWVLIITYATGVLS